MSELPDDISKKLMLILKEEEEKTDLDNLAVLSRIGMKVASSTSADLDADEISASCTALIDLGLRLSEATAHGALREIILHSNTGYTILMAINDNYLVFGGLSAVYRVGYYLGYFRELTKKLNILISGDEISEITLSLYEEKLKKVRQEQEKTELKAAMPIMPSNEQDQAAMDGLLSYLDEWDKEERESMGVEEFEDLESDNIVSIPKAVMIGFSKTGKSVEIPEQLFQEIKQESQSQFKLYKDEVPPIPLDDYSPMDVGEQPPQTTEDIKELRSEPAAPAKVHDHKAYIYKPVEESEPKELPSFDDLPIPDFESKDVASEYDTKFILEEESEDLEKVLKDLGWEEED